MEKIREASAYYHNKYGHFVATSLYQGRLDLRAGKCIDFYRVVDNIKRNGEYSHVLKQVINNTLLI